MLPVGARCASFKGGPLRIILKGFPVAIVAKRVIVDNFGRSNLG